MTTVTISDPTACRPSADADHNGARVMAQQISKSQFKARALEYFRQIEETGEILIITDRGQPCLEVRRFTPSIDPAHLGPLQRLRGSVLKFERPTDPAGDVDDWEALQ